LAIETVTPSWNKTTNPYIEGMEVVREGDKSGLGMVLRFTLRGGREVGVISLPQAGHSRTGPTWAYLMDIQGWTLIDAGPRGALDALEDGLKLLGRKTTDLKRVIITHGHQDHDGSAYDLVKASGAELWAHELYFLFLPYGHDRTGLDRESPLHRAIHEIRSRQEEYFRARADSDGHDYWRDHMQSYMAGRRNILEENLPIHAIHDGDELGDLRFMYTPGHAIDELCISLDEAVFTGDHILPQITPHPTFKQTYPDAIIGAIPAEYQERSEHYGLACYLKSLGKVLGHDRHATVFPAHRLYNHNRFNIRNLRRAQDIMRHHLRRLDRLMEVMEEGADTAAKVTENLFPPRKLTGGGFFAAVSEVVSHLELLADIGDIHVSEDGGIRRNGTTNYRAQIQAMTA
jgi:glyoxylase-like metal-dependent hydrolase (beta-lactamase superfamily II)